MAKPAGVILAGGLARRMGGGDKALLTLNGHPLLSYAIDALRPQVSALAVNANDDPARFAGWGLPVITDAVSGAEGPLAGILAGLRWAQGPVMSVPVDTPFLPPDLVARLQAVFAREAADVVMAARAGQVQPVIALWSPALGERIAQALKDGARGVEAFARTTKWAVAPFDDGPDPFLNINTPGDLAAAEARFTSK